ncbi:MAG: rod shape-determining protein MreD [Clostridiaceae bacterium]|jgi:rod shape-determining protein MreD|nr:rod shape-determining protein MreD [Clostridiaceae bacterium]
MRYRVLAAAFLVLSAAALQSTVMGHFEVFSVRPNILITLAVVIALLRGSVESGIMGVTLGLTMDILMGKVLGWYALLLLMLSIVISLVNEKLYRDKLLVLMSFGFLSTVAVETLYILIIFLFRGYRYIPLIFSTVVLPEAVLNSILILPLFKPVGKVYNILDTLDRKRNRLAS